MLENGKLRYPTWRKRAIRVATKNLGPVVVQDVDRVFKKAYVPQPSTIMLLEDEAMEKEISPEDSYRDWLVKSVYAFGMRDLMHRQYGTHEVFLGDEAFYDPPDAEEYTALGKRIADLGAHIFFETVYKTRQATGATLGQIIQKNYLKLTGRVEANLVDHADGARPEELQ